MTTDPIDLLRDRLSLMDDRLDRMETGIAEINRRLIDHPFCPAPGTCLHLQNKLTYVEEVLTAQNRSLHRLERWQSGIIAVASFLAFVIGPILLLFGPAIRAALKIP